MNIGSISKKIRTRETPKDVFYTPEVVAKKHIEMIECKQNDIWYDDSKGKGIYYDNFPTEKKEWSEIRLGKDLFDFDKPINIICGNPPYSLINKILEKSVSLKPRIISYLIGQQNFTPHRLNFMNDNGYGLIKLHLLKIRGFFGYSYICIWEKNKPDILTHETKNYYGDFPLCDNVDKYGNKIKQKHI